MHNAGVMATAQVTKKDGTDFEMATNYTGTFLLTNLLLPSIDKAEGRIIFITSDEYKKIKIQDLNTNTLFERKEKV